MNKYLLSMFLIAGIAGAGELQMDTGTFSESLTLDGNSVLTNEPLWEAESNAIVRTNHTGNVSIDGILDASISRRGSTNEAYELNEFVSYNSMLAEIAKSSTLSLYGNTNLHPILTSVKTISRDIPDAWCITNTYPDAGTTNLVGTYLYTNYVNNLRYGVYIGRFYARKVGSGDINTYMELVITDGATTNVLSTSAFSGLMTTAIDPYRLWCALETNTPVATNFYMGVNFYAVKTGVPTVDLILCGGLGYLTSLDTPGLAAADGIITEVDPVAATNTWLISANQTNLVGDKSGSFNFITTGTGTFAGLTSPTAYGVSNNALIAFGKYASAGGENAVAFGFAAAANGKSSVAFQYGSALSEGSLAFPYGTASGTFSVAMGGTALGTYSVAHQYSTALGGESTSFGRSRAGGYYSIGAGRATRAYGMGSLAAGYNANDYEMSSYDDYTFCAGIHTSDVGYGQVALGYATLGGTLKAEGSGSVAIGQDVNALHTYLTNGEIGAISVTDGGDGYHINDMLTLTTGNGNASIKVTNVGLGQEIGPVNNVVVINGGSGYSTGAGQATSGGNGSNCTINVYSIYPTIDEYRNNVLVFGRGFSSTAADSFNIGFGQLDYEFSATTADFQDSDLVTTGTGTFAGIILGTNAVKNDWPIPTPEEIGAATTAQMAEVQGRTNAWNTAATDASSATGDIAVLHLSTGTWTQASADASAATNWLGTNTLQAQINTKASTNLFAGAGTTGLVASATADTNKFLQGNGSWGTPAGAGDFLADGSVAMTGDLNGGGNSATNFVNLVITNTADYLALFAATNSLNIRAGNLEEATNTLNANKLDASSTNALAVTALQITGGSPTNGAVFVATNTAGQGTWNVYPKIYAKNTTAYVMGSLTVITFPTLVSQIGGTWDGTNWTPGVVSWVLIQSQGRAQSLVSTHRMTGIIRKNGVNLYSHLYNAPDALGWICSFLDYCDNVTNTYGITAQDNYGAAVTNSTAEECYFRGTVLP